MSRPLALLPQVVSAIAAPITGDKKENSLGFKKLYSCEYFQIQKKRERGTKIITSVMKKVVNRDV